MVYGSIPNLDNENGKFRDEVQGGSDGTRFEADHFNVNTIDELANVVIAGGLTPANNNTNVTQLRDAILALIEENGGRKLISANTNTSGITRNAAGDTLQLALSLFDNSNDVGPFDYFIEPEIIWTSISDSASDNASIFWRIQSTVGGVQNFDTRRFFKGHYGANGPTEYAYSWQGGPIIIPNVTKAASENLAFYLYLNSSSSVQADIQTGSKVRLYRRPAETAPYNYINGSPA